MSGEMNTGDPTRRQLFDFEKEKFTKEHDYKRLELENVALKDKFNFIKSPLALAVLGGLITMVINSVTNFYSSQSTIALEREKLQSELIKKYLEVPEASGRVENLRILVASGLIPNYSAEISEYLERSPEIAPQTISSAAPIASDGRTFGDSNLLNSDVLKRVQIAGEALVLVKTRQTVREWQKCTGFLVSERIVATIGYCVSGPMEVGSLT